MNAIPITHAHHLLNDYHIVTNSYYIQPIDQEVHMGNSCRRISLGTTGNVRESKVEWTNDGFLGTPSPTLHCRNGWYEAYVELCGPEDVLDAAWGSISECGKQAALAGGLAAIFANPGAGIPAAQTYFSACIGPEVASKVSLSISVSHESSDWGPC